MVHKHIRLDKVKANIVFIQKLGTFLGLLLAVSKASAIGFDINEDWKFETNSSISLGQNWSTQDPSASLLYRPDAYKIGKYGASIDTNGDDGRANFSKGDAISQIVKGYTEFRLNGKQQGAVLSTKYWYDHAYETGHGDLKAFDDSAWPRLVKFKGIDLWDAYIWKNSTFDNGQSFNFKLGKHVFNWGKSQFFQNGLNSINAFDYAAMNRPGGDPREKVIPVEMFSFSAGLSDKLKLEGFYQFKFRPSVIDGCGTFFAASDFVPENCGPILITFAPGDKYSETALRDGIYIPRSSSQMAKDNGQYGFSLKRTLPSLNDAELGVYFANYHSRNPNFDAYAATAPGMLNFKTSTFYSIYPTDIKMYGLSLTGKIDKTNIFSELTYKPNLPMQFNGTDVVYAEVLDKNTPLTSPGVSFEPGEFINAYRRLPVTQFSIGASSSIPNILGASSLSWSAEAAVNHIAEIGDYRFGRTGPFGRSEMTSGAYNPETGEFKCTPYGTAHLSNDEIDRLNERFCNDEGFMSEWSYGYRLRGALNYQDLLPATVVTPSLTFRHDVHGYSQNFQEGQMSIAATLSATYQKKYTTELAYYNFFGSNEFSMIDDRDFVSLSLRANF
ncbi:MAG: DUF1302 domain-containing protein [Acinetobacter sp.]